MTAYARDVAPTASQWALAPGYPGYVSDVHSGTGGTTRNGKGSFPLVLPTGRLLHANTLNANFSVAEVTYSEHGGGGNPGDWTEYQPLNFFQPSGGSLTEILPVNPGPNGANPLTIPTPGFISANGMPSMTYDPTAPSNVLCLYGGRVATTPRSLDLFMAWGRNGGAPLPGETLGFRLTERFRLSDDMLLFPTEPRLVDEGADKWAGSACMDAMGRIHMVFSMMTTAEFLSGTTKTLPSQTQVHTRYAMWSSIAALASGQHPFLADLLLPNGSPAISEGWEGKGNDYQMAVSPDCSRVYIGFVCKRINTPGSTWDVYHTRIDFPLCAVAADIDQNSALNSADVAAFGNGYLAGSPVADLNRDGANTPPDVALFMESFACQCNPH